MKPRAGKHNKKKSFVYPETKLEKQKMIETSPKDNKGMGSPSASKVVQERHISPPNKNSEESNFPSPPPLTI